VSTACARRVCDGLRRLGCVCGSGRRRRMRREGCGVDGSGGDGDDAMGLARRGCLGRA
jgi:hypothetical protein